MKENHTPAYTPVVTTESGIKNVKSIGDGLSFLIDPPGFTYSGRADDLRGYIEEAIVVLSTLRKDDDWKKFFRIVRASLKKKRYCYLHWCYIRRRGSMIRSGISTYRKDANYMTVYADLSHCYRFHERDNFTTWNDDGFPILSSSIKLEFDKFFYSLVSALYDFSEVTEMKDHWKNAHTARRYNQWRYANAAALELKHDALGDFKAFHDLCKESDHFMTQVALMGDCLATASVTPLWRGIAKIGK